ncbi:MAG: CRISPR-associated endonuclease Cas1 [Candidatus Bipolaricaulia bacterium]
MNTLYVRGHQAHIGLQKDALIVSDPDVGKSKVPLAALDSVVLLGNGQMSTQALARCTERSIRVSSLRRGGKLRFTVGGPVDGSVHLRVAQLRRHEDADARAVLSRTIVAGKLQNCRRLLKRWAWDARGEDRHALEVLHQRITERLSRLPFAESGDAIRGVEGDGTRWYFEGLALHLADQSAELRYSSRSRRPPRDPVNALLSFTYSLLLTEIVGALDAVGLDPQIGFLHGVRSGRPSLALDMLEEFRPAIADRFVVRLLKLRILREGHFTSTLGGACYLSDEGREVFLREYEKSRDEELAHRILGRAIPRWTLPQVQATLMARHLRGDLPEYPPYISEP